MIDLILALKKCMDERVTGSIKTACGVTYKFGVIESFDTTSDSVIFYPPNSTQTKSIAMSEITNVWID